MYIQHDRTKTCPVRGPVYVDVKLASGAEFKYLPANSIDWTAVVGWRRAVVV